MLAGLSAGCASLKDDRLIEEATQQFHQRWAARQFHEIYTTSYLPERAKAGSPTADVATYVNYWSQTWRDNGVLRADGDKKYFSQDDIVSGTRWLNEYRNAQYSGGPVVENFQWRINGGTIRLFGFMVYRNSDLQCERGLLGPSCRIVSLGPVTPALPPGESVWSLRKDYETVTCEVFHFRGNDWQTWVYENGVPKVRPHSGSRTEALQVAKRLRVDFERPGWVVVGEDRN